MILILFEFFQLIEQFIDLECSSLIADYLVNCSIKASSHNYNETIEIDFGEKDSIRQFDGEILFVYFFYK